MKFACFIGGELRGVKKTIKSFYKNVIDYYDADILIVCQKQFDDDEERIKLFDRKVKYIKLYDKPDIDEYFNNKLPERHAWCNEADMQLVINGVEAFKLLEGILDEYDYVINLRIDIEVLFPFPDKDLFEKIPHGIYITNADYYKDTGGHGYGTFIHRDFFRDSVMSIYENIIEGDITLDSFIEYHMKKYNTTDCSKCSASAETLIQICLEKRNILMKHICPLNFYYTAESVNDRTTSTSEIIIHPQNNVICKYEGQVNEAYAGLELCNKNYRWSFKNDEICLVEPEPTPPK